ncbi:MAG: hypothetical protein Q4E47_01015 [Candidatus Saccharibacteria bacterium]|nr:hypothetical protein [Candidatus Saccharibacteria bacterium]
MSETRAEKMFTFLRGVCSDGLHPNTSEALGFARDKHAGDTRANGAPYIIHPLSLACDAVGLGLRDDIILAMLILHDVAEDTDTQIMDLPVDDEVRHAVECMTLRKMPKESKLESKYRYYGHLRTSCYATIGKALDRRDNLGTMARDLKKESWIKNVYETEYFLLPLLKEAKLMWPRYASQLHTVRKDLRMLVDTLAVLAEIKELPKERPSDEFFKTIFI